MNGRFLGKKPIVVMLHIRKEQRRILKQIMKGPDPVVIGANHEQLLAAATGGMLTSMGNKRIPAASIRGGPNSGPVGPLFIDNPTAMRVGGAAGRGGGGPGGQSAAGKGNDPASVTAEIIGQLSQIRQLQLDLVTNQQLEIHQASQGAIKPNSKYEDERKRQQRLQQQQFIDYQLQKVIDSIQQLRGFQQDRFEALQQQHVAITAVAQAAYRQSRQQQQPPMAMVGGAGGPSSMMMMQNKQQQNFLPQQQRTVNGFQVSEPAMMGGGHAGDVGGGAAEYIMNSNVSRISPQYSNDSYGGGGTATIGGSAMRSTVGSFSSASQFSLGSGEGDGSEHGGRGGGGLSSYPQHSSSSPNPNSVNAGGGGIVDRMALKEHLFNLVRDRGNQKALTAEAITTFLLTNATNDELMQVLDNPGSLLPQYVNVALDALEGEQQQGGGAGGLSNNAGGSNYSNYIGGDDGGGSGGDQGLGGGAGGAVPHSGGEYI